MKQRLAGLKVGNRCFLSGYPSASDPSAALPPRELGVPRGSFF